MDTGLLVIRLVVGLLLVGHGTQKLLGWFGGYGIAGTGQFMESLGFRPGRLNAALAGLGEAGGGLLLALGLLTPLGAAAVVAVMLNAIVAVHMKNGVWVTEGGYEYNAVLIAVALGLAMIGPGQFSLDHALDWNLDGVRWGAIALGLGLVGAAITLVSRRQPAAQAGAGAEDSADTRAA